MQEIGGDRYTRGRGYLTTEVIPCAVESPGGWNWSRQTRRRCSAWRGGKRCPGIRCIGRGWCWRWQQGNAFNRWRRGWSAIRARCGGCVGAISKAAWPGCWSWRHGPDGRWRFPPLQRAQIVQLACLEPIARGLHITHWSREDLARQVMAEGIVPRISARTVGRILEAVDLQPHRTRYWKTPRVDAQFKRRAARVLWCYAHAPRLAHQGQWVVCVDEMPHLQVLERQPIRRAVPGHPEQQEFDYVRHGTVTVLLFLMVHSGWLDVAILERKDAQHYIQALEQFRRQRPWLNGAFLVQDNDPSHTAGDTQTYLADARRGWRPRFTPAHASWLNQAEIGINCYSQRYLQRRSWTSREEFIQHILDSKAEYNYRYAQPIEWTWTNPKMRRWFDEHAS